MPQADLEASFKCPIDPANASATPLMFVTGTGATGDQGYLIGQSAFEAYGHPVCYVNFPDFTTADIQVSVQYLVYGLRQEFKLAGRKVAVFGISQGGLLPRFVLTYWPDLQRKVSDVLSAAGTQHGTSLAGGCSAASPCTPAGWQQARGSNLLEALNAQPDETPGDVAYTTVRSLTDETVQPQGGKRPTPSLDGARNILIQDVCPGRATTHIGTAVDSVSFAAFVDAIADNGKQRKGAAQVSRLPSDVCDHPYATGLDEATTAAFLGGSGGLVGSQEAQAPKVAAEPKVRRAFTRVAARGPRRWRRSQAIAEHFCQKPVRSDGVSFGLQGSGVRCNFIHFWAVRWLDHRGTPKGWRCVDIGESGDCHRRDHGAYFEYYALD